MKVYRTTMGTGADILFRSPFKDARPAVIVPNRAFIERAKAAQADGGGLLGVDFFTFDDVVQKLAIDAPRGEGRAVYYFRRELRTSESVFSDLRDIEKVRALFRLLEEIERRGVAPSALPYSWREEVPALIRYMEKAKAQAGARTEAEVVAEALENPVYDSRPYVAFGFAGFEAWQEALVQKLDDAVGMSLVLPFEGEGDDAALSCLEETFRSAETEIVESSVGACDITCCAAVQPERIYRDMAERIYDKLSADPGARIGVVVLDEKERRAAEAVLRLRGVPVCEEVDVLAEDGTLSTLRPMWRLSDKISDIAAYLRSPLSSIARGAAFAPVLESLGMDRLSEWRKRRAYRLFLDEADAALLNEMMPALTRMIDNLPTTYAAFRRSTEAVYDRLGEEVAGALADAIEKGEGDYGEITGEEFEAIVLRHIEGERTRGVRVTSLMRGCGGAYDALYVSSLDHRFPRREEESDLVHYGILEDLQAAGLYLDYGAPERDTLALKYTIASSKEAVLYKAGDGEEAALFAKLKDDGRFLDLDSVEEVFEDRGALSTSDSAFTGEARERWKKLLKGGSFSPSAVDAYRSCPFKFFAERVLKIDADDRRGRERLNTGIAYHSVLEHYFKGDLALADIEGEVDRLFEDTLADLVPEYLHTLKKKEMCDALVKTIENEEERLGDEKKNKAFKPSRFEVDYSYPLGAYWIRGKIDRIDADDTGREVLIDYKSKGVPSLSEMKTYDKMQLSMYALARSYLGKKPVSLEYVSVEKGKESVMVRNVDEAGSYYKLRKDNMCDGEEFAAFLEGAREALEETIAGIEGGSFPAEPSAEKVCDYCPFSDICRKDRP
ncbi:MAG: PD-(D/E)XK nuclease family protein [Peptoniphilus sp.]|nr:PD-(D/E)XK nuclease family protein [Peptoniphilus sp.]MDD7363640.1 PD-(D/E)XK nuclease family protein [Bacillota bacterium]MDY6044714.1 PD-(D/E)XK nuclease family protein [Peptoniphilus sp.]